jgi:hypothetical protein
MTQKDAEQQVKRLQKEFLAWLEENLDVDAARFEEMRRLVFRRSFASFRLGVVGIPTRIDLPEYPPEGYLYRFANTPCLAEHPQLQERFFKLMLEAFRFGTTVWAQRELLSQEAVTQ